MYEFSSEKFDSINGEHMELTDFIKSREELIQKIELRIRKAWWDLAISGEEKHAKEWEQANNELRELFSSNEDFQALSNLSSSDSKLNRQKSVLLNEYRENQIPKENIRKSLALEAEIEEIYTTFRPQLNGKQLSNNDLKQVLVESNDKALRQAAWENSKLIGEQVEEKILQLISLRNENARLAGFEDFYSMRLELQELDQTRLFNILDEVENKTTPYWTHYKDQLDRTLADSYGIQVKDLMPWHYHDPFFQEAPMTELDLSAFYKEKNLQPMSAAFFKAIGLPVEKVLEKSDLYEREKKNQHAFCVCIDKKQDIRILCNLKDNEYWMGTLLHELGHAVYDQHIDQGLPYLLRTPSHICTTEASAMLFGRLSKNGEFLHRYSGVEGEVVEQLIPLAQKQLAANLLVFVRWALVMIHFERAMYRQPGIDLNSYWWDCVERFQKVKRPPGRNKPDWASKLHLACAPVYYQNYVLGEMMASQLYHHILGILTPKNETFCSSNSVGEFLSKKLYALGNLKPWEETLKASTEECLNPEYFIRDVSSGFFVL